LFVLALAAAIGIAFGALPQLDLTMSGLFFDPAAKRFPFRDAAVNRVIRDGAEWVMILLVAPAVAAIVIRLALPRRPFPVSARSGFFLVATLALGPGLLVNAILKDHWPRPRPVAVSEFGGTERFVAWWDPRGACPRNCSFVSGEAATAFWTLAPAALVPPPWRALALTAAAAYGIGIGGLRLAAGAHFFTDVAFAGVFTFLLIWLAYRFLFRPPAA
jgi:membrane-associated PAP2 superfamily phosphatase